MNRFCSIFSQLLQLFPRWGTGPGDQGSEAMHQVSGWGQFVAMLFCQLGRERSAEASASSWNRSYANWSNRKGVLPLLRSLSDRRASREIFVSRRAWS